MKFTEYFIEEEKKKSEKKSLTGRAKEVDKAKKLAGPGGTDAKGTYKNKAGKVVGKIVKDKFQVERQELAGKKHHELSPEEQIKLKKETKIRAEAIVGKHGEKVKKENEKTKAKDELKPKNKEIKKVDQSKDKDWNKKFTTINKTFMDDKKNKDMFVENKDRYNVPSYIKGSDKFNKRDVDLFERLLNSKNAEKYGNITNFSEGDKVGLGTIQSQFGELSTMIMISLDDDTADKFYKDTIDHLDNVRGGKTLTEKGNIDKKYQATRDWITAAYKTRNSMKIAVEELYPGKKIEDVVHSVSWDRVDTVNAMGFDYTQKESSTDVFVKFKNPKTNKEQMMELSLKKSFQANLYNGGLSDQQKLWTNNTPEELTIKSFQNTCNTMYNKSNTKEFKNGMKTFLQQNIKNKTNASEFIDEVMKKYKDSSYIKNNDVDTDGLINDITDLSKGNGRVKRKLQMLYHVDLDKQGNKESGKFLKNIREYSNNYIRDNVYLIKNNKKIKSSVLNSLKENIPLKGILEGQETLFAGQYPLTSKILEGIFGTKDWNKIVENIDIKTKNDEHYLCYTINTGETINIADIKLREDGVGYGQVIKFEMKFTPENKPDSLTYKIKNAVSTLNQGTILHFNDDEILNEEYKFDLNEYFRNKVPGSKLSKWLLT